MSFFGELAELVAVRYSRYQEVEGDICHISLPCESDSMANMARSHVVKHTQSTCHDENCDTRSNCHTWWVLPVA